MTISTEATSVSYNGNGATTAFPVPFRFLVADDLIVTLTDPLGNTTVLVNGTDYTVDGADDQLGGTVTLGTAPATGYGLSVARDMTLTQPTDFVNQGAFYAEVHEESFDRVTMLIQQVRDQGVTDSEMTAAIAAALAGVLAGTYNPVTATGSTTARTLEDRFAVTTKAEDHGLLTASTSAARKAAIEAAIAATPIGGTFEVETPGIYDIDQVTITRKIGKIKLAPGFHPRLSAVVSPGDGIFHLAGAVGASTTLAGSATPGAIAITVASTAGIGYGTIIRVKNLSLPSTDYAFEFRKVLAVSGSTVYLMFPLYRNSYPSGANGEVTIMDMWDGPVVEGGIWDGNDLGDSTGISFEFCANPVFKPERVQKIRFYGADFAGCINPVVIAHGTHWEASRDCDFSVGASPDAGYAVNFREGTQNGQCYGGTFEHFRHCGNISTGAYDVLFDGMRMFGMWSTGGSTHFRRAGHVQYVNCIAEGDTWTSASNLTRPTAQAGFGISTTDTKVTFLGVHGIRCRGSVVRLIQNSGAIDVWSKIIGVTAEECQPNAANGEATIYAVDSAHIQIGAVQLIRSDDVNYPMIRLVRCDGYQVFNVDAKFTNTMTGGGTICRGLYITDSKHGTALDVKIQFDGTGVAFRLDSTNSGDCDDNSFGFCKAIVSGGGTEVLFSANATNLHQFGNSWPDGEGQFSQNIRVGENGGGARAIEINGATNVARDLRFLGAGNIRFILRLDATNGKLQFMARDTSGVDIDVPFEIGIAAGGAMTALRKLVTLTSAAGGAGLLLPQGAAPSAPVNGEVWMTSAGLFYRANGSTVGPVT